MIRFHRATDPRADLLRLVQRVSVKAFIPERTFINCHEGDSIRAGITFRESG
jgi:hypothetical protein